MFPAIYIGSDTWEEAKSFGFLLVDLARPDIEQFLQDLSYHSEVDVLLTDLASRPKLVYSALLKFVEEFQGRVVVYSSRDVVSDTILSRFKTVKKSYKKPTDDQLYSVVMGKPFLYKMYVGESRARRRILDIWI